MKRRHFLGRACQGLVSAFGFAAGGLGIEPLAATESNPARKPITLFLAGDVMLGRGVDYVLPHPVAPAASEDPEHTADRYVALAEKANGAVPRGSGFEYVWGDALQELDAIAPAVRLINLETSVTTSEDAWPEKVVRYRMNPANTPVLRAAGIDGCSLANNHVLDFGYRGLTETLESLKQAGVQCAGAGETLEQASAPAVFDRAEGRVLLFSAATRSSGVPRKWAAGPAKAGVNFFELYDWDVTTLAKQVQAVKRPGDIAILSLHWGYNWGYEVTRDQREFAHAVIDEAGIDLVHGHSSHHPRGIEVYRNKAIIYGCGDLINDYEGIESEQESFRSELVLMYFPTLDLTSGELLRFEIIPMRRARLRLQRASREEAEWLAETMDRHSRVDGAITVQPNGRIEITD